MPGFTAPSTRNKLWLASAFGLLILLAYSNSFANGFAFDSRTIILQDPRVWKVTAANLQGIWNRDYWWPHYHTGLYRPLTTATFLLNYAVFGNGQNPAGYHALNLIFHLVNVWLLFLLALRLLEDLIQKSGSAAPAFFAAALWAVHPIGTESVTNLVGRADELAAMAIFGGLLLYQHNAQLRGWRRVAAAVGLFAIAVLGGMAKEFAAVLIGMMLLWDLVRDGGIASWRDWLKPRWPFYLAAGLALGVFFWGRWRVIGADPPAEIPYVDNPLAYAGFWTAKLTALKVICLDLWLMIFPLNLSSDRSYDQIHMVGWGNPMAYLAILIVGGLLAVVIVRRRQDPLMFWCAGFFAIALLPAANLVVTIGSIMAERFLYLPSAAFAIAITALAFRSKWRRHAPAVLGAMIALYAVRTYIRNPDWTSDLKLSSHDAAVVPDSFKMHGILARTLLEQSNSNIDAALDEAKKAWDIVRRLPPERVPTETAATLGAVYREKGRLTGGPSSAQGHDWYLKSLAVLLDAKRDSLASAAAYDELQEAQGKPLAVRLEQPDLYLNLGLTYKAMGRYEEAREAYRYGRQLSPEAPDFYGAMADNYIAADNLQWAAISLEEKMLQVGPEPETVAALARIFAKLPGGSCALSQASDGAKLNMGCPAVNVCLVWADLAQMYSQGRKRGEANEIRRTAAAAGCPARLFDTVLP